MRRLLATFITVHLTMASMLLGRAAFGQDAPADDPGSVRVNVTRNPDGTTTNLKFDTANHKATAVTLDDAGKQLSKTIYRLDQQDRFGTSVTLTAHGEVHHKSLYKYDTRGRMEQETQLDQKDVVRAKIVYSYDANGKQTGYSIFDASGKLLGQTSAGPAFSQQPAAPQAPPVKKK